MPRLHVLNVSHPLARADSLRMGFEAVKPMSGMGQFFLQLVPQR